MNDTTQAINNAIDKFVADGVLFRQTLAVFHEWLRQYDMGIVDVAPGVWRVIHLKDRRYRAGAAWPFPVS